MLARFFETQCTNDLLDLLEQVLVKDSVSVRVMVSVSNSSSSPYAFSSSF